MKPGKTGSIPGDAEIVMENANRPDGAQREARRDGLRMRISALFARWRGDASQAEGRVRSTWRAAPTGAGRRGFFSRVFARRAGRRHLREGRRLLEGLRSQLRRNEKDPEKCNELTEQAINEFKCAIDKNPKANRDGEISRLIQDAGEAHWMLAEEKYRHSKDDPKKCELAAGHLAHVVRRLQEDGAHATAADLRKIMKHYHSMAHLWISVIKSYKDKCIDLKDTDTETITRCLAKTMEAHKNVFKQIKKAIVSSIHENKFYEIKKFADEWDEYIKYPKNNMNYLRDNVFGEGEDDALAQVRKSIEASRQDWDQYTNDLRDELVSECDKKIEALDKEEAANPVNEAQAMYAAAPLPIQARKTWMRLHTLETQHTADHDAIVTMRERYVKMQEKAADTCDKITQYYVECGWTPGVLKWRETEAESLVFAALACEAAGMKLKKAKFFKEAAGRYLENYTLKAKSLRNDRWGSEEKLGLAPHLTNAWAYAIGALEALDVLARAEEGHMDVRKEAELLASDLETLREKIVAASSELGLKLNNGPREKYAMSAKRQADG